jgi:hypothetical protein
VTIVGARVISSCLKVITSTTCNRDVCCRPDQPIKSPSARAYWHDGCTSVNVKISFQLIPELNLNFLTPQPGALLPGIVQSHVSLYSQPLAVPIALLPLLPIPPTTCGTLVFGEAHGDVDADVPVCCIVESSASASLPVVLLPSRPDGAASCCEVSRVDGLGVGQEAADYWLTGERWGGWLCNGGWRAHPSGEVPRRRTHSSRSGGAQHMTEMGRTGEENGWAEAG